MRGWLSREMFDINKYSRQHPLAIIDGFKRYIALLLVPLVRSLLLFTGDPYSWLRGVWLDVLVLAAMVLAGLLRWMYTGLSVKSGEIESCCGVLLPKRRHILFCNVSSVTVEHTWYFKPVKAVRVRIETDAGNRRAPDVKMLLRREDADHLCSCLSAQLVRQPVMVRRYEPRGWYVGILSLITSDSIGGAVFAATLISQSGKLLGQEAEDRLITSLTKLMRLVAFWLPPAAAVIAGVLLGGWLIDFVLNLIRHLGFRAVRRGGELYIRCGIVTVREYLLSAGRVNFLQLRQSILTKIFGYYAGMVSCTGYGKGKNEQSVLLPAVGRDDLRRSLSLILPELRPAPNRWHPPLRTLWRIIWPDVLLNGVLLICWRAVWRWLPSLRELVLFLGMMMVLPAAWHLLVRLWSFFHTGIGRRQDTFTFRAVKGYKLFTVVCRADKVDKIVVTRSIFQRQGKCADIHIWLRSERRTRIQVANLALKDIREFLSEFEDACQELELHPHIEDLEDLS